MNNKNLFYLSFCLLSIHAGASPMSVAAQANKQLVPRQSCLMCNTSSTSWAGISRQEMQKRQLMLMLAGRLKLHALHKSAPILCCHAFGPEQLKQKRAGAVFLFLLVMLS